MRWGSEQREACVINADVDYADVTVAFAFSDMHVCVVVVVLGM